MMFGVRVRPDILKVDVRDQKNVDLTLNNVFIRVVVILSYICQILVLFNRSTFEYVVGPVFAACTVILMFTPLYYVPISIVLLTPHAIGTVFFGRLSQYMLLGFMLIFRLFIVKFKLAFKLSDMAWLFLGLFNWAHTVVFLGDDIGSEKLDVILIFTLWMIYIRCDSHSDEDVFNKFLLAFAVAIATNAMVSLVSRSATLYANSDRMGIIGFGSGDPNIAAMIITFGIAIFISSHLVKVWMKIIVCILLFFSLITTVSISGLIGVAFILLVFAIIMNKNKHNLSVLLVIILGALIAVYLFPMLGIMGEKNAAGETVNYLEYFQEKLYDRAGSFMGEDIDSATSGRSELTRINLEFFSEQSALKQLFGGNHVNPLGINVSHNCFADILLRFGYIGLFGVVLLIIYSVLRCLSRAKQTKKSTELLCKLLMLYWSLSLSLFDSNGVVMWFTFVLML